MLFPKTHYGSFLQSALDDRWILQVQLRRKNNKRVQKHAPEAFCKKDVLKNFVHFTGKHLCFILFLFFQQITLPWNIFTRTYAPTFHHVSCHFQNHTYKNNPLQINFIEITLRHGCSPVNLLHLFRITFPKNTSVRLRSTTCYILQ